MTKAKYQVFLDERAEGILDALCKRFGWSSGQCIERLIRYYAATQKMVTQMDIDDYDDAWGQPPEGFDEETGQPIWRGCVVWSDPENVASPVVITSVSELVDLVEVVKEGLTPIDGFDLDEEER